MWILKRVALLLLVGIFCIAMGGVGATLAVSYVPSVRSALRGDPGRPGLNGPAGPAGTPGPAGPAGETGLDQLSGAYVVGTFCPRDTWGSGRSVITEVRYDPGLRSVVDDRVLIEPSIVTDSLRLCEIP
jgi:hypothetical protein